LRCYFCVCILSHPCLFNKWPFLSATLFVIGTCYIDQGVSLLLFFYIVFIFYKTLPVHCTPIVLRYTWKWLFTTIILTRYMWRWSELNTELLRTIFVYLGKFFFFTLVSSSFFITAIQSRRLKWNCQCMLYYIRKVVTHFKLFLLDWPIHVK